ncbi:DUF1871 family protein [Metabacillus sp. 84]|uniref:DUF1871 family protein n=1 Tax=unclassified Metabacillus TaxID=2675274 RepID=UPI003CF97AFB
METQQANEWMMDVLYKWDPLGYGEGFYETEAVDVVQAVHELDSDEKLARKIQAIYEHSFEKWIAMDECLKKSKELLHIKSQSGC